MKLVSSSPVTQTTFLGRKSDGSDRQTVVVTTWTATVLDDDGFTRTLTGLTFDPSLSANAASLYAAITPASAVAPTTKADWARAMNTDFATWLRWKTTRVEAQARGVAANIITALTAQENAAWNTYANDVLAWNSAT